MTGCDKGVLPQAQPFREVQKSVKNKPRSLPALAVLPARDPCLVTARAHAKALLPPGGCGDFLTAMPGSLFTIRSPFGCIALLSK